MEYWSTGVLDVFITQLFATPEKMSDLFCIS